MCPDGLLKGLHVHSRCTSEGNHEGYDGDGSRCSTSDKVKLHLYRSTRIPADRTSEDYSYDTISLSKLGTRSHQATVTG